MKKCYKCKNVKNYSEFNKCNSRKDGYQTMCRQCSKKYHDDYYEENNKYYKDYYKENVQQIKNYKRSYYKENADQIKTDRKEYYQENIESVKKRNKKYYQENIEQVKEKRKKYYQKNIDYFKRYSKDNAKKINERQKQRYRKDINYRIKCNLRNRLYYSVSSNSKFSSVLELLGCSIDELKQYLEKQFKGGMSWGNYGKGGWEVDHIKPCASFNLEDPEEQKKCFHYTNLQPLWAEENWSKGASIL